MELFQIILSALTPIVVAILGIVSAKKEAENKKIADLEKKLHIQEAEERKETERERDEKLTKISEEFTEIKQDIKHISSEQQSIKEQVRKVEKLSEYNLEFSTEINNALMNLSDRIIDEKSDDVLRKDMQEHRKATAALSKKLYDFEF